MAIDKKYALKRELYRRTGANPEKYIAGGKRLAKEAMEARAEEKRRCNNEVQGLVRDAVGYMCAKGKGRVMTRIDFADNGVKWEKKPIVCDFCGHVGGSGKNVKGLWACRDCEKAGVFNDGERVNLLIKIK